MLPLEGRRILVTGASAGIGRATALTLAQAGAQVLATGRRQDALSTLQTQAADGRIQTLAGDLNDAGFAADLANAAAQVDVFVNNAGVLRYAPVLEITDEDTAWMFQTNVLAAFRISQAIARHMVARGQGQLVFVTSIGAREVFRMASVYAATKHALSAMARAMRLELQGQGLRVTEVAPGMVDTDIRASSDHPEVLASLAARRFAPLSAQDVAQAVLYAVTTEPPCCPDLIELRPQGAA
ncbi:MAG: SDR family oxidoreductase [Burkholderiaceae bacterium]